MVKGYEPMIIMIHFFYDRRVKASAPTTSAPNYVNYCNILLLWELFKISISGLLNLSHLCIKWDIITGWILLK